MLVLLTNACVGNHLHDCIIIHNDATLFGRTTDCVRITVIRDFNGQILAPTVFAVFMATAQIKSFLQIQARKQKRTFKQSIRLVHSFTTCQTFVLESTFDPIHRSKKEHRQTISKQFMRASTSIPVVQIPRNKWYIRLFSLMICVSPLL